MGNSKQGVVVTMAATGINLALGVLYAWSVFKDAIAESIAEGAPGGFTWSEASLNDPYAVACLCFAFAMIPAGRLQDARGPRLTAMLGLDRRRPGPTRQVRRWWCVEECRGRVDQIGHGVREGGVL